MILPLERPKGNQLTVTSSDKGLTYWATRDFITEDTRTRIAKANLLLTPGEGYINTKARYFPQGTEDFYHFLLTNAGRDITVEACIEDGDYKELAQHADLLQLAQIVTTFAIAPLVINLVSAYIYDRLRSRVNKTDVKAKVVIVFGEGKQTVEIAFDGPATEYQKVMESTITSLKNNSLVDSLMTSSGGTNEQNADNLPIRTLSKPAHKKRRNKR
jgi:hypothetical protein